MPNVLIMGNGYPAFSPEATEILRGAGCDGIRAVDAWSEGTDLPAGLADADVLMVARGGVSDALLEAAPKLRLVARIGQGSGSVDVEAARRRGIPVTHAPGTEDTARAELALGLLLSLVREVPRLDAVTRTGVWIRTVFHELPGRTLGILGSGSGAKELAALARGFGLRPVAARDASADAAFTGVDIVDADSLIRESHYISVHLDDVPANRHAIGREVFAELRDEAILVNVSGENLLDPAAAEEALSSGRLSGLACCVAGPLAGAMLYRHERCIGYPCDGPLTEESYLAAGLSAARNVAAVLAGGTPEYRLV